jgi:hypothetical protein
MSIMPSVILLNFTMPSVIMLSVIVLSAVAPSYGQFSRPILICVFQVRFHSLYESILRSIYTRVLFRIG